MKSKRLFIPLILFTLSANAYEPQAWIRSPSPDNPLKIKAASPQVRVNNGSGIGMYFMTDNGTIISSCNCNPKTDSNEKKINITLSGKKAQYFRICNPFLESYLYRPATEQDFALADEQLTNTRYVVVQGVADKPFSITSLGYTDAAKPRVIDLRQQL